MNFEIIGYFIYIRKKFFLVRYVFRNFLLHFHDTRVDGSLEQGISTSDERLKFLFI